MTITMSRVSGWIVRGRGAFAGGRGLLAVALLAGGALAAAADDPLAAAGKDFAKGVKDQIPVLKAAIKAAEKLAFEELSSFEQNLDDGILYATSSTASNVANDIEDYQESVRVAQYDAITTASWLGHSFLDDLQDAGLLGEGYPEAFLAGTRGPVDELRERSAKLAAASATRLRKRLDQTIAKVDQRLGYAMAIRLEAARPGFDYTANPGIVVIGEDVPLTVDFAVAVSTQAESADALLIVGGLADPDAGDVDVLVWGDDSSSGDSDTPHDETHRWRLTLDDGDDLFTEQNAVVRASQGTGAPVTLAIGMP
jgi:hypothetical protein